MLYWMNRFELKVSRDDGRVLLVRYRDTTVWIALVVRKGAPCRAKPICDVSLSSRVDELRVLNHNDSAFESQAYLPVKE